MERTTADRAEGPVRVFLLDGQAVVLRGIRDLLEPESDIAVVGAAGGIGGALSEGVALRPDVVVVDVRFADGHGIPVCRALRSGRPELACLMLTSFDEDDALLDAVMAGAAGYVPRRLRGSGLVAAIRTVAAGRPLLDPSAVRRLLAGLRSPDESDARSHDGRGATLTDREQQVLTLVGDGLTDRRIGRALGLPEGTVRGDVVRILTKLGIEHRVRNASRTVARPPGDRAAGYRRERHRHG
ncbi:response regulator transcription factor [Streptomyces sp. NPDC002055]|uniref:response regulator transcription factor n=1 Tax=Streptomyces sp. NPDC002055 TaxID=3154534 RepID=UPI0033323803